MPSKLTSAIWIFFIAILLIDSAAWSSTKFACYGYFFDENGKRFTSNDITIKIDLPSSIIFWRNAGSATFDGSNFGFTSTALRVDDNYRINFLVDNKNDVDGYIYLITEKAELRNRSQNYLLSCKITDHS